MMKYITVNESYFKLNLILIYQITYLGFIHWRRSIEQSQIFIGKTILPKVALHVQLQTFSVQKIQGFMNLTEKRKTSALAYPKI